MDQPPHICACVCVSVCAVEWNRHKLRSNSHCTVWNFKSSLKTVINSGAYKCYKTLASRGEPSFKPALPASISRPDPLLPDLTRSAQPRAKHTHCSPGHRNPFTVNKNTFCLQEFQQEKSQPLQDI